jgi:hypothetical protein
MLTKKEVMERLQVSSATLQRRMAAGSITYVKEGEGNFTQCYFPEDQFPAAPVEFPETTPLAASRIVDPKPADPQPLVKSTQESVASDFGHDPDKLDDWLPGALLEGQKEWRKPARTDGLGVPTNQPDVNSSTMPTPENYARLIRAEAILQLHKAKNGETPRHTQTSMRKMQAAYLPTDAATKEHNSKTSSLGQAQSDEDYHAWVRSLSRSTDNDNPLRGPLPVYNLDNAQR